MNRKRLEAIQRGFAQKICKAYRTASLTSVQALSGTLPLDLRIQENATLYRTKKGIAEDFIPPGRKLEAKVKFQDFPHPSNQTIPEYELLEDMDPTTQAKHNITGPQIYTDGSKIEGKVGAALTWWEEGRETESETFSLDPTCTVFQSELYALHKAIIKAKESGRENVNILSDSRSSLELLANPKLLHPLAKTIKECISEIRATGKQVRLFWLRAHVGTEGNERADELAKLAAVEGEKTLPDYAEVPLSYVRKKSGRRRSRNGKTGTTPPRRDQLRGPSSQMWTKRTAL
jgi:ribonuclease HI